MSDLSRLLEDIYRGPSRPEPPRAERREEAAPAAPPAPPVAEVTPEDALESAFADWVPGPVEGASDRERDLFADAIRAESVAPAPEADDDFQSLFAGRVTVVPAYESLADLHDGPTAEDRVEEIFEHFVDHVEHAHAHDGDLHDDGPGLFADVAPAAPVVPAAPVPVAEAPSPVLEPSAAVSSLDALEEFLSAPAPEPVAAPGAAFDHLAEPELAPPAPFEATPAVIEEPTTEALFRSVFEDNRSALKALEGMLSEELDPGLDQLRGSVLVATPVAEAAAPVGAAATVVPSTGVMPSTAAPTPVVWQLEDDDILPTRKRRFSLRRR